MRRIVILVILAALGVVAWKSGLLGYLSLTELKDRQDDFTALYTEYPLLVLLCFFAIYVAVTALSLPGAAVLTLAAGALFGLVTGTLVASFASTIGATLAFLTSRYLLRDWVESRFGERLKAFNQGIARDGAFYLFSLRLIPVVPFFVINLAMGLTVMRARTFYWVSQIGMVLGTLAFVNAGTQLARIDSLSGILSPALIGSFVLLGLVPWLAKAIVEFVQRRRVYKGWKRPRAFDRNLIVIGAGAAGLVSSLVAATVRAKVTLVEKHRMGGDCLNFGCVPSKALIRSARVAHQIRTAETYGLTPGEPQFSFRTVMARVHAAIAAIAPNDSVERYSALGVDVVQGHARIVDPWTVEIRREDDGPERLTSRAIIIAAGAAPFVPPIPGLEPGSYLTSDTLWDTMATRDAPPARLVVLGGGPIGCELAQAFARLGSRVTLVEMADRVLVREDEDVSAEVATALGASGVEVLTGHAAVACHGKALVVEVDGITRQVPFDDLLIAVGRSARLTGFGLEELGIETGRTVAVNEYMETAFPNILAAGDVAGPYQFTHTAAHQAWYASVNALFGQFRKFKADYRTIPAVTFTDPEVARVGLNEREAREQGVTHEVTRFPLHELDRAITDSATHGFVKVLTAQGKDRILGVTIVGEHAGEVIGEYVLAMRHGLGLNKIIATVHAYPTYGEANKFAAGVWKKAHAPKRLLAWVERYHRFRRGTA